MTLAHDSVEWLAMRQHGLGASEMGAIVNVDPYRTSRALALEKRGLTAPQPSTWRMRFGNLVQPIALATYAEMTGRKVQAWERTSRNKTYPHLFAHLDGKVVKEAIGVEAKWTTQWNEPPQRVVVQALGQIGIARLDAVDIIRLSPSAEPAITTIERDDAAIRDLLELCEAWWCRYVEGPELPPVDGSDATRHQLERIRGLDEMQADDRQARLVMDLRETREELARLEARESLVKNQLRDSMAGAERLTGDGWHITWRQGKDRVKTDWKLVAAGALRTLPDGDRDALLSLYTETEPGTRPFVVTFDEEAGSGNR